MSWMFPHRFKAENARRLDATITESLLANEAVSKVAADVRNSAGADRERMEVVTLDAGRRVAQIEVRKAQRRQADPRFTTAQGALQLIKRHQ